MSQHNAFLPGYVPGARKFTVGGLQSGETTILSATKAHGRRAFLFVQRGNSYAIITARVDERDGQILEILGVTNVDASFFADFARAASAAAGVSS